MNEDKPKEEAKAPRIRTLTGAELPEPSAADEKDSERARSGGTRTEAGSSYGDFVPDRRPTPYEKPLPAPTVNADSPPQDTGQAAANPLRPGP